MLYICQIDAAGYFLTSQLVDERDACPPGWIWAEVPEPPEGLYAKYEYGFWTYTDVPPPIIGPEVPFKVHKFWLTKVLEALGEMDGIEDSLDDMALTGNRGPRRAWQSASEIERSNQLLNEIALLKGYTSEQVDQMFIQAAALQAASMQNGSST